jgi:hypothetical protein
MDSVDSVVSKIVQLNENSDFQERIHILNDIKELSEQNENNQVRLGSTICMEFVLSFFDGSSDIKTVEISLMTVISLCRRNILQKDTVCSANLEKVRSFGLLKFILLLKRHLDETSLVLLLCQFIMVTSSDSESCQKLFCADGVSELIVSILTLHDSNDTVLEMACRAVRNLSSSDEVACKFIEDGIGERIEFILRTHNTNEVLEAAVWAVVNLSYDIDVSALLGSVGCCKAVVDVAQNLDLAEESTKFDTAICWAIRNLSCPSLNLGIFASTNVCSVVKNMIVKGMYQKDYDLVQSAIWCVNNLSCGSLLREQLHLFCVADLIVDTCLKCNIILDEEAVLGPVAEASVFAIRGLCVRSDNDSFINQDALGRLGACQLVCDYLSKYIDREGMVESCFATIVCLCRDHVRNASIIGDCGGLNVILSAIDKHRDVLETVEIGLKTILTLILDHSQNAGLLLGIDGARRIVELAFVWKTDYDVCSISCELLLQLKILDEKTTEKLLTSNQLTEDGLHARPAGRFEDIAVAWGLDSFL